MAAGSPLGGLDTLNPGRFAYLDGVLDTRGLRYQDLEVLDLGCGGGLMSEAYARRGARVTGVDPSTVSLKVARAHARESSLSIRYKQGRGEALPFPDASFDLVSCCDVLEHVDNLDAVIHRITRVLRPDGIFFFDTINRTWLSWLFVIEVFQEWLHLVPAGTHDWNMFITPGELGVSLARAGLEVRDLSGLGPSLDPLGLSRAAPAPRDRADGPRRCARARRPHPLPVPALYRVGDSRGARRTKASSATSGTSAAPVNNLARPSPQRRHHRMAELRRGTGRIQ